MLTHQRQNILLVILTIALSVAAVWLGLLVTRGDATPPLPPPTPVLPVLTPSPSPTPQPTATPQASIPADTPIAMLLIPTLDIEAPVVTKGVDAAGAMQDPEGPDEVAWYDFSALPGAGSGNIVMAGHHDVAGHGPAVFHQLAELAEGDEIVLELENGETVTYRVASVDSYDAATAPVQDIVGPTDEESVTLITRGGELNLATGEYDERVIVRATRSS